MAPCLVYAFMEGDSLQDRLACRGSGALVQLTADERILCDVARGLTSGLLCCLTLHGVFPTCNRRCVSFTVTSRAPTCCWTEVDSTVLETLASLDPSTTTTVVLETLTGYVVCSPAPGHLNLLSMFDQEIDSDSTMSSSFEHTSAGEHAGTSTSKSASADCIASQRDIWRRVTRDTPSLWRSSLS